MKFLEITRKCRLSGVNLQLKRGILLELIPGNPCINQSGINKDRAWKEPTNELRENGKICPLISLIRTFFLKKSSEIEAMQKSIFIKSIKNV